VRIAVVLVAFAGCHDEVPRATSPPLPVAAAPAPTPAPDPVAPPRVYRLPRPGSAKDDFPHRRAAMVPRLAAAQSCVPRSEENAEDPGHDTLTIELDHLGSELVACVQQPTRRDVSVFFDVVSYACWNVDPATGHLTRRADLGRSYYRCQDGGCATDGNNQATSFDGTARVVLDGAKIAMRARPGDAELASFPTPAAFVGKELLRGEIAYIGHLIFLRSQSDNSAQFEVFDERGTQVATLSGRELQVVDDDLVLAIGDELRATAFDPRTRTTRALSSAGCTHDDFHEAPEPSPGCRAAVAATHFDAVRFKGKLYGIDQIKRALVELDPATFRERKRVPIATCP
jgi:hypothetical protein